MRKSLQRGFWVPGHEIGLEFLCYTDSMQDPRAYWSNWARLLHSMGITQLATSLLEGAGSLRFLAAQMVHASAPFWGNSETGKQWQALAAMLEDRESASQFISFLNEEDTA